MSEEEEEPEPMVYSEPPDCREDDCASFPIWEADTQDADTDTWYTDYVCGRHLSRFLADWVCRHGTSVRLTRRVPGHD